MRAAFDDRVLVTVKTGAVQGHWLPRGSKCRFIFINYLQLIVSKVVKIKSQRDILIPSVHLTEFPSGSNVSLHAEVLRCRSA
jgi:hypothetical protein